MALVKCEECGKEISNKAKNCPHCGYPVEQLFSNNDGFMEDVYSNITKMSKKENFKVEINNDFIEGDYYNTDEINKKEETKAQKKKNKNGNFFVLAVVMIVITVCSLSAIMISTSNDSYNIDADMALYAAESDMGTGFKKSEIQFEVVYSSGNGGAVVLCEAVSDNAKDFYNTFYGTNTVYYAYESGYGGRYSYALAKDLEGAKTKMGWND